mgnify:CR=1 FL=1
MELYLDTASLEEIREIAAWGVLSGVTTNPTLVAKAFAAKGEALTEEAFAATYGRSARRWAARFRRR